jgi:hypothetical protein
MVAGLNRQPGDIKAMPLPAELIGACYRGRSLQRPTRGALLGVDEDLPSASYAGQYETVPNVAAADSQPQCVAAGRRPSVASRPIARITEARVGSRWRCSSSPWSKPTRPESPSAQIRSPETATSPSLMPFESLAMAGLRTGVAHWLVRGTRATAVSPRGCDCANVAVEVAQLHAASRLTRRCRRTSSGPYDGEVVLFVARPITALPSSQSSKRRCRWMRRRDWERWRHAQSRGSRCDSRSRSVIRVTRLSGGSSQNLGRWPRLSSSVRSAVGSTAGCAAGGKD